MSADGEDALSCTCDGTGPEGPLTVACGESACGSDHVVYSCSEAGWTWTGQPCSGNGDGGPDAVSDALTCQCNGTGPGGVPVTVSCGESACGSDYYTYACSAAGWSWTGESCAPPCECNGTGPGGVPVTVSCGESACGSDYYTYACSASGWSWTGQECGSDAAVEPQDGSPETGDAGAAPDSADAPPDSVDAPCDPDAMPMLPFIATEMVGRPTDHSITVSVIAAQPLEAYFEYGTSGAYGNSTPATVYDDGMVKTVIDGLAANTRYHYRMQYRPSGSCAGFLAGAEHTFHTQRPPGSTFTFAVQSDSHQGYAAFYNDELYGITMGNIASGEPDFLLDLGDAVSTDDAVETEETVRDKYLSQRMVLDFAAHSMPVFLAMGNHENEEGWNLDDFGASIELSLPVLGANGRKRYFLNPAPDTFYTGNLDPLPELDGDHLREDYYAFHWGDALFVVLDPFWYTMTKPYPNGAAGGEKDEPSVGNRWDWTLGDQQYAWLKQTLEASTAKYKLVFMHHPAGGGTSDYIRAGALGAKYCEWGGYDADGTTWAFDSHRPGWEMPVHRLLEHTGVAALFHGHDHVYAYEVLDGIVYQETPHAANSSYGTGFPSNPTDYPDPAVRIANSGHLRVTVAQSGVTVDYVRSFLPGDGTNGEVARSYTILPCEQRDSDGDGISDCDDGCQGDPTKTEPGLCGCHRSDADSDGDGTEDCHDGCPDDPLKTAPGLCGCGYSDEGGCPTFMAVRVGDGSATLGIAATAVFLEKRLVADGALLATTQLSTNLPPGNRPLTLSGSAPAEGALKRSVDGHYVTLAGYATAPGTAQVARSAASTVNRLVARVAADGTIDTTTSVDNAFNGNSSTFGNVRGVATIDGTAFWIAGYGTTTSGGIWYAPLGASSATNQIVGLGGASSPNNMRTCSIFADQLYATGTSASPFYGVFTIGGSPPPTSSSTATNPSSFPDSGSSSAMDAVVLDRDPGVAGADTIYVGDERTDGNGGIQKWTFDGSNWNLAYKLSPGASTGIRHLLALASPASVRLLGATTVTSANAIVAVTDTGSGSTFTTLVTAATNTGFRGLALSPEP